VHVALREWYVLPSTCVDAAIFKNPWIRRRFGRSFPTILSLRWVWKLPNVEPA
ncbi:MAG: hypothetical protein QOH34_1214, partial [Mycobacterium sp.]|nr:hypothetical protein [Mycobacterium sp.]